MTVHELHHPPHEATRHWGGGLTTPQPTRNLHITQGGMPAPDYPLPAHARRLVEALNAAGELWELIVREHTDTVQVRRYRVGEWPLRTDWQWQGGRRTHGPAVSTVLDTLADHHKDTL